MPLKHTFFRRSIIALALALALTVPFATHLSAYTCCTQCSCVNLCCTDSVCPEGGAANCSSGGCSVSCSGYAQMEWSCGSYCG